MPLRTEQHDRVRVLVLDDPPRRNALSPELVDAIVDACEQAERDPDVGALVVTGEPPAFCSGADVSSLAALGDDTDARAGAGLRSVYEGFLRVLRSPLPTVAAVNGPAVGAGFNLALACDVRLAGESARFDSRFLSLGLHPGGGHTSSTGDERQRRRHREYGQGHPRDQLFQAVPVSFGGQLERGGEDADHGERDQSTSHEQCRARTLRLQHLGHGVSAETILSVVSCPGLYLTSLSRSAVRLGSSVG